MLRDAGMYLPTILEIVSENAQGAIDASVQQLDSVAWPVA
jgi:hypothetical protein